MIATTGSLASQPIAHLLAWIADTGFTGSLEVAGGAGTDGAAMTFRRGAVTRIKSKKPIAYLGSILYELGFIDIGELNQSLMELSKGKRLHGRILLDRRSIAEVHLAAGLREQALRKLAHLFGLPSDATFAIEEGVDLLEDYGGPNPLDVDPLPAIWRGIRDYPTGPEVRNVLDRIAPFACRLTESACLARFALQEEERSLAERLGREPLTPGALIRSSRLSERTSELLVYCLAITKQIEMLKPRAAAPAAPPSSRSAAPMGIDSESRAEIIKNRAREIVKEDFFQRLSVPRDASPEQVHRQLVALRSVWESLPAELEHLRGECRVIVAALLEAHRTLVDPERRGQYLVSLLVPKSNVAADLAASGAPNAYEGARACLARNDVERAERLARSAHNASPADAARIALLMWIETLDPSNQSDDAIRARIAEIDKALRREPMCIEALHYRWKLHKRVENHAAAMKDLARVVQLEPSNLEARRELRIYEMRMRRGSMTMQAIKSELPGSGVRAKTDAPPGLLEKLRHKG